MVSLINTFPLEEVYQDNYCRVCSIYTCFAMYQYYHQLPQTREFLIPPMKVVLALAHGWASRGIPAFYWLEVKEGEFLPSEDITWVREDVFPQLVDAGIHYVAYVSKNNLFRNFSHESIINPEQSQSLSLRIFQESRDAMQWLEELRRT